MTRLQVLLLTFALGPVVAWAGSIEEKGQSTADSEVSVHRVDDVAQNPDEFVGKEVEVFGVVGEVYPEKGGLLLIDTEEFKACHTNVACAVGRLIPVSLDGELPAVEKAIVIRGSLEENDQGRLLFRASRYREGAP